MSVLNSAIMKNKVLKTVKDSGQAEGLKEDQGSLERCQSKVRVIKMEALICFGK